MISMFDIFKIGIGPSSSHTVGPMIASNMVLENLKKEGLIDKVEKVTIYLYGSMALTGTGHGSDLSIILGLENKTPRTIDVLTVLDQWDTIKSSKKIHFNGQRYIDFDYKKDLVFIHEFLEFHSNGMKYKVVGNGFEKNYTYYSIGGGFVIEESAQGIPPAKTYNDKVKYPFTNATELAKICEKNNLTLAQVAVENEKSFYSLKEIEDKMDAVIDTMFSSIDNGLKRSGAFPNDPNGIKRRAGNMYQKLIDKKIKETNYLNEMDWVSLYGIAVNEENASFGRVVTAPTNGACGVVPAVLKYCSEFEKVSREELRTFMYTAAIIGTLFKFNASISGAEVGCQGEIGVACSMAAAGFSALKTNSYSQVMNAAEIGMEHNLGLTCDPIGGLVLIPCIERNAIGALKAIQSARIALLNEGHHHVSLDDVIKTMKKTGADMQNIYKETSLGGLAVNVSLVNC